MYYIFAIIAAFGLSAFQYLYKRKALRLFILRFLVYFLLFLLLINPQITRKTAHTTRPVLYILADNSQSVRKQKAAEKEKAVLKQLKQSALSSKFEIKKFGFDTDLFPLDSLNFAGSQTDIANALENIKMYHASDQTGAVILLTDGQTNTGNNYVYTLSQNSKIKVFPIILGDTNVYDDVKIDLLNVNPYAYKNNRFPVEIFVNAHVNKPVDVQLKIIEENKVLYRQKIHLTPDKNALRIQTMLSAQTLGVHHYLVLLDTLTNEKNKINNRKYFSVEIIDETRNILLVSEIIHPDLGALKRSLKINPYLKIVLKRPNDKINYSRYHSVILYQPTQAFDPIFDRLKQKKLSWFIITGKHTDWNFINNRKLFFSKQNSKSFEQFFPYPNKRFSLFHIPELQLETYPPLEDHYGKIRFDKPIETVFYSRIKSIETNEPLLVFDKEGRQGVLLGENIWQWRMQAGLNNHIEQFDELWQQIVRLLTRNQQKQRIQLEYDKQFFQGDAIKIIARFLNQNLEPDTLVNPVIKLVKQNKNIPLTQVADYYQIELSDLPPGTYRFSITDPKNNLIKNGEFTVLPFNPEDKNLQTNQKDLQLLANNTGGKTYMPSQIDRLITDLQTHNGFHSLITYQKKQTDLIDYRWLLGLIILLLTIEWFYKKLRGEL